MTKNPALGDWYKAVSTYTKEHYGPPHGAVEWVEFGSSRLPCPGILHRKGAPDVKVEVLGSAGCQVLSSGQKVCTVFARQMGPVDMIRYRLPTGGQGRAMPKRLYRTPSGRFTTNPRVIQNMATVKSAWLPASSTGEKPITLRGTWVQLMPGVTGIGLVHAPGMGVQHGRVFSVRTDALGRPRAYVRWRQAPHPNGFRRSNPGVRVTTTLAHPDKWWCRFIPGARDCIRTKVQSNPGCTSDEDCPGDNCVCRNGVCTTTDPLGCMPGITARPSRMPGRPAGATLALRAARGNPVSVAEARAQRGGGSGILSALRTGRARLVLDHRGVKLVAA